ncbi:hypothetical protein SASPL_114816 [Salvia splendens]|uniref:Yippee domain-containing protein n=1 Tax=Salvia splendens TaxID=180675 RepID=A0A8X8Y6S8_SALSN|nr:hypothetical protein SASPL_114816 [Salvia splendens]
MHRSHIANADDRRQPRSPLADGYGWINPRIIRIPVASRGRGRISAASRGRGRIPAASRVRGRISTGSRRRSRDDEGLIHHLWWNICRSSIGEPVGSVGDSPTTGGVIGGEGGAIPTRYIAGGEGGASSSGVLSGGECDATSMSDEEFKRRYCVTEAGKALWEKCKAGDEGDATSMSDEEFVRRYCVTEAGKAFRNSLFAAVKLGLMADVCGIIRPPLTHLHIVVFEQPKPTATLNSIPPPCTGLPGDCKLQLCFLKCATRRVNVTSGPPEERMMISGMHTVSDVFCCSCGHLLGWKYLVAHEESQKYKQGKFALER